MDEYAKIPETYKQKFHCPRQSGMKGTGTLVYWRHVMICCKIIEMIYQEGGFLNEYNKTGEKEIPVELAQIQYITNHADGHGENNNW